MSATKKRVVWSEQDDQILIELWAERAADLRRAKRNGHIYADISVQMAGKFSAQDVHTKVRNLTQKYRDEKKNVGASGGSPSTWKHYMAVHQIIGGTAVNNAEVHESFLLDTILNESSQSVVAPSPSPPLAPSTPSPSSSMEAASTPSPVPLLSASAVSPGDSSAPASSGRKRKRSGEVIRIMQEHTELLRSVVHDTKVLTNEVVTAIREQNDTSKEFLNLMKVLIDKI
ncbi:uncharacterized protein LOC118734267 [Rhagoletis pomonella]|uniref:uncharacterized protein LOC118734267 n=1 Tax=Rhagoletis pomonella TaxID=28610 RepID=UPI0017868A88|nr:uncharacterized protein LOC118734267 [Rhagoletis pomonella]